MEPDRLIQVRDNELRHVQHPDEVMQADGYRTFATLQGEAVIAVPYRVQENLVHDRFFYIDDLVTPQSAHRLGRDAALLTDFFRIGADKDCERLVLDIVFIKPLGANP